MICGYIGEGRAAGALLEMTERQEFIFGGFYTGLATIAEGQLYRKRTVGSLAALQAHQRLIELPGAIGIAHSRTDDGGGIEWSQPRFDDNSRMASVGVGIAGAFPGDGRTTRLVESLLKENVQFQSKTSNEKKNGIRLSDGTTVHNGEVFLLGLAREYDRTGDLLTAIRALNFRSESVGLYLCLAEPEKICVVNHNQRLVAAKFGNDVLIATSRLAFPQKPLWSVEIPMNTFAVVSKVGVALGVLWEDEDRFDFSVPSEARESLINYIAAHPGSTWYQTVCGALDPILPKSKATMSSILGHRLLEDLLEDGVLRFEIASTHGCDGQTDIPQMRLYRSSDSRLH